MTARVATALLVEEPPVTPPSRAVPPQPETHDPKSAIQTRVVVFRMAGYEYVVDAALVQEIIQPTDLQPMDGVPEYVEGVIKRRGRITPIVDLRKRLGLRLSPPTVETCAIVANLPGGPVGFVVDAVSELLWVQTHDFEAPPPILTGVDSKLSRVYLQGIAHMGDRLLVLLNLDRLLTPDEQRELTELDAMMWGAVPEQAGEIGVVAVPAEQEHTRADLRRLMTFELSGELYGVSATDVAEIREPLPLMPLPNAPPHVLGLINLRGDVLPVIDLRRKFGLDLKADGPDNRLVILKGPGYRVALWVDSVYGLARLPRADFQPAPPGVARLVPEYYDQVIMVDGRMLIELNVQEMVADTTARDYTESAQGGRGA